MNRLRRGYLMLTPTVRSMVMDASIGVLSIVPPFVVAVVVSISCREPSHLIEVSDLWVDEWSGVSLLLQLMCVFFLCVRIRLYLLPVAVVSAWAAAVIGRAMIDSLYIEPLRIGNDYGGAVGYYLSFAVPFVGVLVIAMAVRLVIWIAGRRKRQQSN